MFYINKLIFNGKQILYEFCVFSKFNWHIIDLEIIYSCRYLLKNIYFFVSEHFGVT